METIIFFRSCNNASAFVVLREPSIASLGLTSLLRVVFLATSTQVVVNTPYPALICFIVVFGTSELCITSRIL